MKFTIYITSVLSWACAVKGSFHRNFDSNTKNPSYPMFCTPLTPNMYNHETMLKDLVTLFEKLQNEDDFAIDFHDFMAGMI